MHYTKETISFLSADKKTRVAAYLYTPETTPKAIFQISHGMCEYIERYEHMIDVLCTAGYAVCGNDHLGHGSTGDPKDRGFFAEENGYRLVLPGEVAGTALCVLRPQHGQLLCSVLC